MFLDYLALVILIMGLLLVFYGFIYIHDIPYKIAKKRNHPHKEAIHVACWLSLFTLHAIWPIVYIWSVYKPRPVRVAIVPEDTTEADDLRKEIASLREQIRALEIDRSHVQIADSHSAEVEVIKP